VIVNRGTLNRVTYVNQRMNNGVTVVSHDAFVNARPVAQNVMRVDSRELAAAPVSHVVAAEPIRASVVGAGRAVSVRPPAAVISRPVVAVRTPPPLPRPIEQRQAQAGGRLNQQALVRPMGAAQSAPVNAAARSASTATPTKDGFWPFTQPNSGNNQVRPMPNAQPRVYEQQGTPQPENRGTQQPQYRGTQQPENRNAQPANQPAPAATHPLVRPAPPVQERSPQQEQQQEQKFNQWHQERPASPPPQQQREPSHSSPPKQESPKKGR